MYKGYSLKSIRRAVMAVAIAAACVCAVTANAQQLVPQIPRLSLTGGEGGYNQSYYPDGRIWTTASRNITNGDTSYILVPVFMKNCWVSRAQYTARPIYSFNFKLQYDSTAVMPVGVVTRGPAYSGSHPNIRLDETDRPTLTDGWQITWDDARDSTYQVQSGLISATNPNRLRGKRVRIAAQSTRPLQPTGTSNDCNQYEFRPLLYVKFAVIGRPGLGVSDVTPMIITTDSVQYNNLRANIDSPFPGDGNYPSPVQEDRIIAGVDYTRLGFEPAAVNTIKKGMIYLHIRDVGRFDFLPKPTGNNNEVAVVNIDDLDTMFALKRVVPMDPILQQSQGTARAGVQLVIKPTGTRITNIVLESDAPWLKFQTRGSKNPIPAPSRIGRIAYIDNGILGPPNGLGFPDAQNANIPNTIDPLLNLDIICDPNELTPDNPDPRNADEWAGRYVGHITLRSLNAGVSPVRLRVVFLYVRTPDETYNGTPIDQTLAKGMTINVRNSAIVPQSSNLMFGTGLRATLNADSLFGEFAYDVAPGAGFFARWFPINATDLSKDNGLGDFTGVFASRDVRDVRDDTTIIYRCRFSAGGSNNYPVVVSWNKNQLPDGAQIYIRDLENGRRFSVNMREATPVPGDPDRLSYTIRDEKIDAFDIEYTPARARIQQNMLKGWNLVSLPVRPTSDDYRVIYPDAQGSTPIKFFADLYQQEERVRVGVGYFLRFPNDVTTVISGILVKRIARDVYPVQVYENWNTIGSLSVPVGVERIGFDPVNNTSPTPQRISGVYTYNTDRGYREISELQPGKGYWIKMNGQGFYKVDAPTQRSTPQLNDRDEVVSASARISVSDNNSRENTIYLTEGRINTAKGRFELPPTPPSDWFDVRFASNEYIATDANPVVKFQGVEYPVTVKMFNNNKAYSVIDAANGNVLGTISVGNGSCQINDDAVKSVRLLTTDNNEAFSAVAAPNPAVDELNVNVTLATNATITVSLYNTMGAQVGAQSLFATKGSTIVPFNTTALASGSYVVKIVAGDNIITRTVNIVK